MHGFCYKSDKIIRMRIWIILPVVLCIACKQPTAGDGLLLRDVTLIDGTGGPARGHMDVLIKGDTIAAIGQGLDTTGLKVVPLSGKTVMPSLISAHVHLGLVKGTAAKPAYYTRDNIISQLKKYGDYGIGNVLVLGTDRPLLFQTGLRDSSAKGWLPGPRIHTAALGFGVTGGAPPASFADLLFRPNDAAQVPAQMDTLAGMRPDAVKIWVDDFGGSVNKMDSAVYKAIITEAHQRKLRVFAHLYYAADAGRLVANGLDVIAHSIRDTVISDALVQQIKAAGVMYIPTLSLDEFAFIYAEEPAWINDPFFKASLEPGVYEMITSPEYREKLRQTPAYAKNIKGFEIALQNVKRLADAGVIIVLGTDSGAQPIRAQGFSEHLELELLVRAGLTPLQALTAGTQHAAKALQISDRFGSLAPGKTADLLILNGDPSKDVKQTRNIYAVYKAGVEVSKGPLQ